MAGSTHLITFRSGCAGFFDLKRDGGTGNLGGFRSGCTSNLIVANGVLNAPDYTRTCGCAYQNRSSLGLIHMPEVEYWTFGAAPSTERRGINFGAPGDRRAADGTLWLEYPVLGGPSAELGVTVVPKQPRYLYHHSSRMRGGTGHPWVAASGVIGAREVLLGPASAGAAGEARSWTVRLYFAELEDLAAGQRVFTVRVGEAAVLQDLDVVKEAGGPYRSVVKELKNVAADTGLRIRLTPRPGSRLPLLCGIELVYEGPR
jgi:hypothetical protein